MALLANPSDEHFDFRSKTFCSVYFIQLILKLKFRKDLSRSISLCFQLFKEIENYFGIETRKNKSNLAFNCIYKYFWVKNESKIKSNWSFWLLIEILLGWKWEQNQEQLKHMIAHRNTFGLKTRTESRAIEAFDCLKKLGQALPLVVTITKSVIYYFLSETL
jgi:hypothetical protein